MSTQRTLDEFVDGETYQGLRKSFLATGKGRRPDPPPVTLTNCLLVMLSLLREEGNRTGKEMTQWFCKLFPDIAYGKDSIRLKIERTIEKARALLESPSLQAFLDEPVNFEFISVALDSIGLNRKTLMSPTEWKKELPICITNAIVVDIEMFRAREKLESSFTAYWILRMKGLPTEGSCTALKKSVDRVFSKYKSVSKDKHRKPECWNDFCQSEFSLDAAVKPTKSATDDCGHTDQLKQLERQNKALASQVALHERHKEELEMKNLVLQEQLAAATNHTFSLSASLHEADVRNSRLTQDVNKLKAKVRNLRRNVSSLQNQVSRQKAASGARRQALEQKNNSNSVQLSKARTRNKKLQQDITKLQDTIRCLSKEEPQPSTVKSVAEGVYTDDMRMAIMALQGEANVAASKCSAVIDIVSTYLFNTKLKLPCIQTCLNIADEGHAVSQMHVGEAMQTSTYTLHTDGTSRDGKKVIGHQITLQDGSTLTLGFKSVATEDAATVLEKTIELLEEIADSFCTNSDTERKEVFSLVLSKMSSIMTDRAAVMKSFGKNLQDYLQSEQGQTRNIHLLECNAHFLLGLSREVEAAMQAIESSIGVLGRDTLSKYSHFSKSSEQATSRLIRTCCDIIGPRGDEKSGCRNEWIAFCEEKNIKSFIPSYRSNRFNCYFEGAAALCYHHEDIISFLQEYLWHSNLKTESVCADLQDEKLMALLSAIGIIYLKVARPYWDILNSNTVKVSEFHIYIEKMAVCFERWQEDAAELINTDYKSMFSNFQPDPTMSDSVHALAAKHSQTVITALQNMMPNMLDVLQRQLHDYLPGGKFSDVRDSLVLSNCPLTNLLGEHAFGDFDFDLSKRCRSSLHHRSSTHMLKRNQSVRWLNRKEKSKAKDILLAARSRGRELRKLHQAQEKLVVRKVRERLLAHKESQQKKEAHILQVKKDITSRVKKHGGPCQSSSDIDALRQRLKTASAYYKALKDEARYFKIVLGVKSNIKVSAKCEELELALKSHLNPEMDHTASSSTVTCRPSSSKRRRLSCSLSSSTDFSESNSTELESSFEDTETAEVFAFQRQGQWVAVFYYNTYYIGQVVMVNSPASGVIKFLDQTKGRHDYFRWPRSDDIAEVSASFVFRWDFDVCPVSSDGRIWSVKSIKDIQRTYENMKADLLC